MNNKLVTLKNMLSNSDKEMLICCYFNGIQSLTDDQARRYIELENQHGRYLHMFEKHLGTVWYMKYKAQEGELL